MEKSGKKRFFEMAETYDKMARCLIPKYDFLQDETLNLIQFGGIKNPKIIDLGAGSGIFIEKVLTRHPNAKCYYVDFSEDFLKLAKKRLMRFGKQVEYIISPIEDDWEEKIEQKEKINAIFSMSAVHHLESSEKKRLYKRCFEMLNDSGWFFNIDEMKTIYKDAHLNSFYFWIKHVEGCKDKISVDLMPYYEKWNVHFDDWRKRNIDDLEKPKTKGDDIHDGFLEQIKWLKEIGFLNVDLFIKFHLWCVIGGQKILGSI